MENTVVHEPLFIPMNKGKMGLFLVIMLVLLAGCVWCLVAMGTNADDFGVTIFAGLCGLIFLYGSILLLRRLMDKDAGLLVAADGITYNAAGASVGFVPWNDVERVFMTSISGSDFGGDLANNYFIMLKVKHPEEYLQRQTNIFRRKAMKSNMKRFGTPVTFSTKALTMKRDELLRLLQDTFNASQGGDVQPVYRPF